MLLRAIWNAKLWIANFTIFLLNAGEDVLVGGQAVFEGVMMRSPRSYSIAVRKPDGSIVVKRDLLQPTPRPKIDLGLPSHPRSFGIGTSLYIRDSCSKIFFGTNSIQLRTSPGERGTGRALRRQDAKYQIG